MSTLPELIEELGDEVVANALNVKLRTVQSWRRRERFPRRNQAEALVKIADGRLDYFGIYGAHLPSSKKAA